MNISKKQLDAMQQKIGYQFKNIDLLCQAFTRSSYSMQYGGENNEVLEFLGDRILDYFVVKILAKRFGFVKSQTTYYDSNEDYDEFCIVAHKNESDFTELKKEIVSNKTLTRRIDNLGFAKYMLLGDSDIDNHVERQEKVKADLFEAIIGAIAIDTDWDAETLQNVVANMLQIENFLKDVNVEEETPNNITEDNAITILKELAEQGFCSIPQYEQFDEQVYLEGKYWWVCTCTVKSWAISKTVRAASKKFAKKCAAFLVLCNFYHIPNEYEKEEQ